MILVTGGTGFIGAHLVETLAARGECVRCLVRRRVSLPAELVYGDLVRGEGLGEALRDIDTVIHLAGVTKALRQSDYYEGNVTATANLLEAAAGVRRFVHVSSLAAIGPGMGAEPVEEDQEPHPLTSYGRSKLASEELVRRSALAGRAVIIRPPVVYGPRDTDVFQILRAASRGWLTQIAGPERAFSAIYVRDLAGGLIAAARAPRLETAGRAYFMAHPRPVTWTEFGLTAARIMGRRARVVRVPRAVAHGVGWAAEWWGRLTGRPGIVSREKVAEACCGNWICATARAHRELGFEAPTGIEEGLAQSLAWYKEQGWIRY